MKIGIITICKVNNYGAELQAFATQKKLEFMGYDAEIIDYTYYKNWFFKDSQKSKPFIEMSIKGHILYWIKYRVINYFVDRVLPIFNDKLRLRKKNYNDFFELEKFSKPFYSIDSLFSKCPKYDVYIVGSDQVWNPAASSSIEPYFLTFAPQNSKKISFASSFGVSQIDKKLESKYKKLLDNINYISVREESGVKLVNNISGKEAKLVLDPTLLINKEEWYDYMRPIKKISSNFILVYELLPSEPLINYAKELGEKLNLPIYCICKRGYLVKRHEGMFNVEEAGPSEFLWLIANATCVITNSFHGTAFSVNFETPFYCVLNKSRKNNSRMISLLSKLDLLDRIIYEDDIRNCKIEIPQKTIRNGRLRELILESEKFLVDSINS